MAWFSSGRGLSRNLHLGPFRLLVAASLLGPLLVSACGAYVSYGLEVDAKRRELLRTADLVFEHANNVFGTHALVLSETRVILNAYAGSDDIRARRTEIHERLRRLLVGLPQGEILQVEDVFVFDAEGHPLVSANEVDFDPNIDVKDREYFKQARQAPSRTFLSRVVRGRIHNTPVFNVSQAILRDGRFDGVLTAWIKPHYFSSFWDRLEFVEHGGGVGLRRSDGPLIAMSPTNIDRLLSSPPTPSAATLAFLDQIGRNPERGMYDGVSPTDGTPRVVAYRRLTTASAYVTVSYSPRAVLKGWVRGMLTYASFGIPATAVIFGLALLAHRQAGRMHVMATRERQVARDAAASRKQMIGMINGISDYAVYMISPEGQVLTWNTGAQRIKHYAEDEILGQHLSVFYSAEARAAGDPARNLKNAALGNVTCEGWRLRKDGSRFWALVVMDPIRSDDGELLAIVKVVRDMTDRLEADDRRIQAQKLAALGQLTGGIAHDFNNLLTVISGSIDLASLLPDQDPKMGRYLKTMHDACDRGSSLIKHLLAFSRRQPLRPVVLNPAAVLNEAAEMLSKTLRKDIEFVLRVPETLDAVEIDPSQMTMALLNVCINARDALTSGGRIVLEASNTRLDDLHGLTGPFVVVHVVDNGCGIAPELLQKVFEPFFTTKEVGKGSGLGLSQAYGFCRQSGGTLAIDSHVGRGTRVSFYLPVATGSDLAVPGAAPAVDTSPP